MPRDITVTFSDGTSHVYKAAPDDITPDQAIARAQKDFAGRTIQNIDGGRGATKPESIKTEPDLFRQQYNEMGLGEKLLVGAGRGFTDVGQGVQQLGTYLGEKIGGAIHGPLAPEYGTGTPGLDDLRAQNAEEEALYQKATPGGTAAGLGRFIGNIAGSLVPSTGLVRGAPVAGAAAPTVERLAALGAAEGAIGGALQPVLTEAQGDDFLSEKAIQTGLGALFGGGLPVVARGASGAANRVMGGPSYLTNAAVNAAEGNAGMLSPFKNGANPQFAKESAQIADEIGSTIGEQFHMTPAQRSGSKFAQAAENSARQNALLADKVKNVDQKIGAQLNAYVDKIMSNISRNPQNAETAGRAVQTAMRKGVDDLIEARKGQAAKDYGAIRAEFGGDAAKVRYENLQGELEKIISEYDGALGEDARSIMNQAKRMLGEISSPDATGTVRLPSAAQIEKAMKNRSDFSKAAAGSGDIFKDVSPAENKRVAARLRDAIEADFDAVVDETGDPRLAAMLGEANKNYRTASEAIERTQKTVFEKVLGKELMGADGAIKELSPEAVIGRIQKMKPTEARTAVSFMRKAAPDNVSDIKRFLIEDALEKTKEAAPSAGADPVQNFNQFIKAMEEPSVKEWFEPEEFSKIKTAIAAMRRLGDNFGKNPSGTQVQGVLYHLMDHPVKGPLDAIKLFIGMGGIAKGMETGGRYSPVGQEAMRKVSGAIGKAAGRAAVPSVRKEYDNNNPKGNAGRG